MANRFGPGRTLNLHEHVSGALVQLFVYQHARSSMGIVVTGPAKSYTYDIELNVRQAKAMRDWLNKVLAAVDGGSEHG